MKYSFILRGSTSMDGMWCTVHTQQTTATGLDAVSCAVTECGYKIEEVHLYYMKYVKLS